MPSLLGPLDAFVAGEGKPLREAVDPRLVARPDDREHRARVDRRQPLGERLRRDADEAAGVKHVERAEALADEVRRRREARVEADAAAGHEGDHVLAQEPGDRLGRVAGLGVLWEQADEASPEPKVQRREQHGQGRLRDACIGVADFVGECGQTLALGELAREDVEHGPVHDDWRNRPVPPPSVYGRSARRPFTENSDEPGHPGPPPTFDRNAKTVTCLSRTCDNSRARRRVS